MGIKTGIQVMQSKVLNFSKNNKALVVTGSIIVGISILSLIYFGAITIRDATSGNVVLPNSLPKTSFGPFSAYHLEYISLFVFLFGIILLGFGAIGMRKRAQESV
jgi:hypothetical protein